MPVTEQPIAEHEAFADLVLSDDDLVRAEFDDLIAACWESPYEPPPGKPSPPTRGREPRPPLSRPRSSRIRLDRWPLRRPLGRGRGPP
ncbi:hypothetical protein [Kribbella shirazensis]|uniref:Uncharacterized protein n=1 Tax=Kribbella shirazensis TaxID=1105143 RepID=A0A7X5VBQ6_9ACTN|nr:hypothetical protein [Kribbella shirazensis]NIK58198.1 hypothetical protein [Kribbella shirazensis]